MSATNANKYFYYRKYNIFSNGEAETSSSDYLQRKKAKVIFKDTISKNKAASTSTSMPSSSSSSSALNATYMDKDYTIVDNKITMIKNYEMLKVLHDGFFNYKYECDNECLDGNTDLTPSFKNILYLDYTYADIQNMTDTQIQLSYYFNTKEFDLFVNYVRNISDFNKKYFQKKIYKYPVQLSLPSVAS
jgi:hypothetical protein